MTLGDQIREKRKKERLSAEDLAIKLGLKKENIYKWEKGSTPSDPEEYLKINQWLKNSDHIPNLLEEPIPEYGKKKTELSKTDPLSEAIAIIKQQNEWLRHLVDISLASLSTDLNNNTAAIRAEIRGYAQRQILKEVNHDDDEFLKAKAEADKIYLLNLKTLLGDNNVDARK